MDRIGIIVPVYNVQAYLDRCVQSIFCQSYQDWKLILVDDGSPDQCGILCDGYAEGDSRIHVIHQKNGGLSAARNAGLDYLVAQGECQWVTFIDSDDWIHPDMLQWMITAAETGNTRISLCAYIETCGEVDWDNVREMKMEMRLSSEYYQTQLVNATIACCKLYGLECFANIRFPEGKLHEDEFVTYQLLLEQKKLAVIDTPLYAYFINPMGITKSNWRPKRLDAWEAFEQQLVYFEQHGYPELVKFRLREYLQNALVNLEGAESVPDEKSVRFIEKRIRNLIRRCWHAGVIHFQYDFNLLVRFYPFTTRAYRFYLEKIKK